MGTDHKNNEPWTEKSILRMQIGLSGVWKKQARKNKKQSAREVDPSLKCGCGAFVEMYVHMQTDHTTATKACLEHSYPCVPSNAQLRLGRKTSGVEPSSIHSRDAVGQQEFPQKHHHHCRVCTEHETLYSAAQHTS